MDNSRIHLGTYRFDYADGNTCLSGRFSPYSEFDDDMASQMNEVIKIVISKFNSLDSIQEYCNGIFGSDEKITPEEQYKDIIYKVKLNPCKGEYNAYIYLMTLKK